ncbi:2-succinyl-5-enolpyruvyl-6-hydroxy-3-cyclohexene-1-carboxylic-acid synthase [Marixanthomonas spongiae]|uniref:2-succinyl-5-enolpyruvyl-6-hydroxy-3-cyclohexene-1-carboxylate synthase n=1 Tax=Marixanthomonas spongiae TaxID=2174845 RepID=A0A2U0I3W4_9FLAO|nr:2-succinyl-5-enolpyruvyl-6-hydroxy-3-cyclohexene-1-carboxylic-acid synthase [Marixanthomonas spongiae]PVW15801.1 2-succinyl-5-enolpyruvyl-6-hydroxy-3-cyclohexene-1-carboxylic-acid synthase [Marixanthomonas spongiae]
MNYSAKHLSQTLTQLCLLKGIDHIVISPGSRNAPLTIGFTENPSFNCFSIVDERCAAFFAMGMAQQTKKPVALVCSSGSALLNYFPAVAEAFYSDIPLVVLSADRPPELLEIGDGQTIQQEEVYGKHILYNANCKEGTEHQTFNETEINIALNTAFELQGPVHVNLPFSEPLYNTLDTLEVHPQHVPARVIAEESPENLNEFAKTWNNNTKKMVLVGVLPPNSIEEQYIKALAKDESVLVLTETTSNLHHENFIPAIDQLITALDEDGFKALRPDILLTFGGMVVSKRIKKFLRSYKPKAHWHVDVKKAYDTYFSLSAHIKTTPNTFLQSFMPKTHTVASTYQRDWLAVKNKRTALHKEYVATAPYSDFKVYSEILKALPNPLQLQVANSAAIRYAQLFDIPTSVHVFCNRGTSGIDGSVSTAVGAAYASKLSTVLITGDLSFFYDSNGLWNDYIPKDFKIILINNSGGGIFRILPNAKNTQHFERFFETQHQLSAKQLAMMYQFDYTPVTDEVALKEQLNVFLSSSEKPKILEVFTPAEVNDRVLLDYFKFIA